MRLRDYPFLVDLNEFTLKELGFRPSLKLVSSDPRIVELALNTIKAAASGKAPPTPSDSVEAVLSFYLTLGLSKLIGASALEAVAKVIAEVAYNNLHHEDDDEIVAIAGKAGIPVMKEPIRLRWSLDRSGRVRYKILPFKVPVYAYLKAIAGTEDPKLSLVNQMLAGGYVYLNREILILLLKERFYKLIKERAEGIDASDLPEDLIAKARTTYERAIRERSGIKWVPEALPECVKEALRFIREGNARNEHVYLAATFIGALSLNEDEVRNLLGLDTDSWLIRGLVNLSREASRLGYTVYTCEALKRLGLCPDSSSCRASNPLGEYFRRARRARAMGG